MILIIHEDGRTEQQLQELSRDQIEYLDQGAGRAFKYDHIAVTFREASPDTPRPQANEEGGEGAPLEIQRTVTWQPLPK